MLFKLAFRNVKRQIGNYLIYFITVSLTVALLFSVNNFIFSDLMAEIQEYYIDILQSLLFGISGALSVVVAFVLAYVTSFLLRRRKKEFGLYLTMGMSRGHILAIFAGEMAVNFLLSLGVGTLIGLVGYQALMAIILSFLEQEFVWMGYSLIGSLGTLIIVSVMFLFASLFSLSYLRIAKISRLLNGEKIVEHTAKCPIIWFVIAFISLVALIASLIILFNIILEGNIYWNLDKFIITLFCLTASIILLPFGLAKGVVPMLLHWKRFAGRGVRTFTLRQLSSRLNANAFMLGILSFLLAVAVVATNFMINMKTSNEAQVYQRYPYDISATYHKWDSEISIKDGLKVIEEYAEIQKSVIYSIYEAEEGSLIRESDYRALCEINQKTPKSLENGYLICWNEEIPTYDYDGKEFVSGRLPLSLNGNSYSYTGEDRIRTFIGAYVVNFVIVVPDEAVVGLSVENENLVVELKNSNYDFKELYNESNFKLQAYERYKVLEEASLYLLISMFVSIVFVMISMAVIALKVLSMLIEDKEHYRTIWRLGADESVLKRSLFAQIFFFFFLPFGIPLALSIPLGMLFVRGAQASYVAITAFDIGIQVAGVALVLLALYALYFTVTYLVAWREVKKTVCPAG